LHRNKKVLYLLDKRQFAGGSDEPDHEKQV